LIDVAIPETKNEETAVIQLAITSTIALFVRFEIVLTAIELNNHSML